MRKVGDWELNRSRPYFSRGLDLFGSLHEVHGSSRNLA